MQLNQVFGLPKRAGAGIGERGITHSSQIENVNQTQTVQRVVTTTNQ